MSVALAADRLGKRYGRRWALSDCTFELPAGRVAGLVGPNGAGKTTLLHLAVGLIEPSEGSISVLGEEVAATAAQLARIGFVAQEMPLYPSMSVADHLLLGSALNPGWDAALARERIARLGLDRAQRAGTLSGGQRAQLALTLALAKRPELLVLDEPVASLDPLARRELLRGLMEFTVEHTPTVVLSSHLVADLERVCDYLILVADGRVQLSAEIDELLASHRRLIGPRRDTALLPPSQRVIEEAHTDRQSTLLVRTRGADPRSRVDGRGGRPRGPRARLHGARRARGRAGEDRPMIRVAWRQFRMQALVSLGLLAAFAAVVIALGLHLRDEYSFCIPQHSCAAPAGTNSVLAGLLGPALIAIPAMLGMFWGAPLVARELEGGTFRLAWTQSVTRRHWLSIKLALVGVAALAVAGFATWLVSWGLAPIVAIDLNHFAPSMFTARGIVAIGYAAFAFALGVLAGALIRRTLPAMVTTLVGFIATRVAFTFWIRPHLLPARDALFSVTTGKGVGFYSTASGLTVAPGLPPIPNAWMVSDTLVDRTRGVLSAAQLHGLLVRTCPTITNGPAGSPKADAVFAACQQRLSHHLLQLVTYQPPSHYWPLQAIETGIFLAASLALIAVTVWLIGPRRAHRPAAGEPAERTEAVLKITSLSVRTERNEPSCNALHARSSWPPQPLRSHCLSRAVARSRRRARPPRAVRRLRCRCSRTG